MSEEVENDENDPVADLTDQFVNRSESVMETNPRITAHYFLVFSSYYFGGWGKGGKCFMHRSVS
jgi:hypothetical protein